MACALAVQSHFGGNWPHLVAPSHQQAAATQAGPEQSQTRRHHDSRRQEAHARRAPNVADTVGHPAHVATAPLAAPVSFVCARDGAAGTQVGHAQQPLTEPLDPNCTPFMTCMASLIAVVWGRPPATRLPLDFCHTPQASCSLARQHLLAVASSGLLG